MIENSNTMGLRYYGMYRGIVVKQLPHGQCKVFIPGIYNHELATKPNDLPTCQPSMPLFGGGANGNGMFSYPELNAVVWVFFENGDINHPVMFAASPGNEGEVSILFEKERQYMGMQYNYIAEDVDIDSEGPNMTPNTKHAISIGPTRIELNKNGQIIISVSNKDERKFSSITLGSADNPGIVNISSSDEITISAPKVIISANTELQLNGKNTAINSIESTRLSASKSINMTAPSGKVVIQTSSGQEIL